MASATPIAMPKLGMSMTEGTLISWPIEPGTWVEKGQIVVVIESEKTEAEVEATGSGYLRHTWVSPDDMVPCGSLLGVLTEAADSELDLDAFHGEHHRPEADASATPLAAGGPRAAPAAPTRPPTARAGAPAAPAARAVARKLDIDLATVPGSGPGGRVLKEDVEAWAARREALRPASGGIDLEVAALGEGAPVLLLPGFGSDPSAFAGLVPELAKTGQVLGVNPRGVGLSDAPESDAYSVEVAAADAAAVLSALEDPALVIGASLGSAVALELALAEPGRVRGLVLVTPFVDATPRLLTVIEAWCEQASALAADALALALLPWLCSDPLLAADGGRKRAVRGLAQMVARVPAATLERQAAGLRDWAGSRGAALADLTVPSLIVAGADDLLVPLESVRAFAAAIPGAEFAIAPGAGHALALEAGDFLLGAIQDWEEGAGQSRKRK